ncbi:MAG TPA: hypothetical protein VF798_09430 [Burkholderiaceae bacterium]
MAELEGVFFHNLENTMRLRGTFGRTGASFFQGGAQVSMPGNMRLPQKNFLPETFRKLIQASAGWQAPQCRACRGTSFWPHSNKPQALLLKYLSKITMGKELPMHIRTTCFLQEAQYVEGMESRSHLLCITCFFEHNSVYDVGAFGLNV